MKIYLAAKFSVKDELREYAKQLRRAGHVCTSRWLAERSNPNADMEASKTYKRYALRDIEDMDRSDIVALFTVSPLEATKRGGRHFESGYAYGIGKPVVIIGPNENIFHELLERYDNFAEFLEGIGPAREVRKRARKQTRRG